MLERTLGQELVPQGRERVVKFMHWEILHRQEQGEAAEPQRAMQIGAPKAKYREDCISQPMNSSQVLALPRGLEQGD